MFVIYASNMSIVQVAAEWTSIICKRERKVATLLPFNCCYVTLFL